MRKHFTREHLVTAALLGFWGWSAAVASTPSVASTQSVVNAQTADHQPTAAITAEVISDPDPRIASLIRGDRTDGKLDFEFLALPLGGSAGGSKIAILVELDGPSLLKASANGSALVEVYAYAFAKQGTEVHRLAEAFTIDSQAMDEIVWQGGVKYYGQLSLPAGRYDLHVLVQSHHSDSPTVRVQELLVPSGESRRTRILAIVPPPPGRDVWLPVSGRGWSDHPFVVDEQEVSPLVRPVFVGGRRAGAHIFAHRLPAGDRGRIELLRAGSVVASAALAVGDRGPRSTSGTEAFDVGFEAPRVAPGEYGLRVAFSSGVKSLEIPVVMMPAETRARRLLWADLRGNLPSAVNTLNGTAPITPDAKSAEVPDPSVEQNLRVGRLQQAYRDALSLLAHGQGAAARAAVLDLESAVLTGSSFEELQAAQLQVVDRLAIADIESLLPVLILHDELYLTYRNRKLFGLGSHSRALIEKLAEIYARRGGTEGSRVVAARALASLAGRLQEANLPSNSRRLYQRAIDFDPHNKTALLGLAISYERYGEYSQAIGFLETVVGAHPSFGEGLLRLAVNLDRLGVRQRSQELLTRVVDSEAPDWVRSIAFQESARLLMESDQLDQAASLLERGLEETSDQYGTIYLLTHIYDRRREAYRALDLIKSMPTSATNGISARKIYDGWPAASLEEIRVELSQAAAVRASLLAKALGSPG